MLATAPTTAAARRRRPRRPRRPATVVRRGALPCTSGEATRANGGQPAARSEHLQPLSHTHTPTPSHTLLLTLRLSPSPQHYPTPRHPDPRPHPDPHADPHPRPLARWATPPDASTKPRPCFRTAHYLRSALRLLGVLRRRGGTAARHGTARLLVASDSGAAVAELAQLAAAEGLRVVAVQSDRGEAWGGAAEGAALGLKREAALEHFIEQRNGRGLVDRRAVFALLLTTYYLHLLLATCYLLGAPSSRRSLQTCDCCARPTPSWAPPYAESSRPEASANSPSSTPHQRQIKLRAAFSVYQPGPIGGGFLASGPYRPWFPHRHRCVVDLPSRAARHQRRGGRAAALRAARQAAWAALVRVTPPTPVEEAVGIRLRVKHAPNLPPGARADGRPSHEEATSPLCCCCITIICCNCCICCICCT